MLLFDKIRTEIVNALHRRYGKTVDPDLITVSPTRREFTGDMTVVIFPLVKELRIKPAELGPFIGEHLVKRMPEVESFNQIQGFVNLSLTIPFWHSFLERMLSDNRYGAWPKNGEKLMIEFSSPNTNKPLHLGHIRNILLGWSCSKIVEAAGFSVVRVQVVNDRGIAICKSMLAWQQFGNDETPDSAKMKGDHFVGKFYVLFETKFAEEYRQWQETEEAETVWKKSGDQNDKRVTFFKEYKNTYFNEYSALGRKAKELLQKWESGDRNTLELWERMNTWVYDGFEQTYQRLGVQFDKLYFESETWKLGKQEILDGVKKGKFYEKEDRSVWVDLSHIDMDEKILLRSDGTSVYMTQDIGTAMLRYRDYGIDRMVYVVADEQNYHFKVLFEILNLLDEPYSDGLHHLAYGMVDLPDGKMKSREGTVVDADDLMDEVIAEAKKVALEKSDISDLTDAGQEEIYRTIGMAALKFFILKVNPQKRMIFDPGASVDMQGQTGPYIQNAYVRIRSIERKLDDNNSLGTYSKYTDIQECEKVLLNQLFIYPEVVRKAAADYDPSHVAGYCYDLAKSYHRFYHDVPILGADVEEAKAFRLGLNRGVAKILAHGMDLLGIEMPERM
ncbi:MAG: arginine--tRNA ligase [Saprospiraceae bacterium]|nr:arginine--tRNA ligase [Saprospiraceae bacterium]